MPSGTRRRQVLILVLACAALATACGGGTGGVFNKQYEYEEELYLSLDGTATVNVNASVPALVALRGADLDVNPRSRLDRNRVRALFAAPGVEVTRVSLSRRDRRRFVHVSVDVPDVRQLARVAPFAWSRYRFERDGDVVEYRQVVGAAANKPVGDVGWTGRELIAFRMHVPSRIPFHNSPGGIQRGNILEWEQPLADRLRGVPLDLQVQMEPQSILYSTLLLFASTIVAAALTFAVVLWWVARRGRSAEMAESRP
jgi:hypothetical protein